MSSPLGTPQLMLPGVELIGAMTGSAVNLGSLLHTPVKLIMDNQTTASVVLNISTNGGASSIQWHTFPAGEAIILDDDLWAFPKGTTFFATGTNGTGSFSVSYTYINSWN